MKKSIRLLFATIVLAVTVVGAAAPVKTSSVLGFAISHPACGPDGCVPDSN